MHPRVLATAAAFALMVITTAPANAGEGGVSADLEGRPLKVAEIANYHCHDFDYPRIRCFATTSRLEDAVAERVGASSDAAELEVTTFATGFAVRAYENATYNGASIYLSQPYNDLSSIGWNDRISSYKVMSTTGGEFHTDSYHRGTLDSFCCSETVPYVGDALNDKFSSVR